MSSHKGNALTLRPFLNYYIIIGAAMTKFTSVPQHSALARKA